MNPQERAASAQVEIKVSCLGKALLKTGTDILRALNRFFNTAEGTVLLLGCFMGVAAVVFILTVKAYMHFMEVGAGRGIVLAVLTYVLAYAAVPCCHQDAQALSGLHGRMRGRFRHSRAAMVARLRRVRAPTLSKTNCLNGAGAKECG